MMALLWGRMQNVVAAIALVIGAVFSAWVIGRKSGGERVRAHAAAAEQNSRRLADEAARDAQRSSAADRLRDGKF